MEKDKFSFHIGRPHIKNEIRKNVEHFTFSEARLHLDNIYDTLIAELYEQGDHFGAERLTCLVKKENELMRTFYVGKAVKSERKLLDNLFECAKTAGQAARLRKFVGMVPCAEIMNKMLLYLMPYDQTFEWLILELYNIFVYVLDKHYEANDSYMLLKAKFYCGYALMLMKYNKPHDLQRSLEYYEKCLSIVRGKDWLVNDESWSVENSTLHEFVCAKMCDTLICAAKLFGQHDENYGLELAHRALLIISEVPSATTVLLLCNAYLMKIRLIVKVANYENAMKVIALANETLSGETVIADNQLKCKFLLYKGTCLHKLGQPTDALQCFRETFKIGLKNKLEKFIGRALLQMGLVYQQYPNGVQRALMAFDETRQIGIRLNDIKLQQRCKYAVAALISQQNTQKHNELLRKSEFDFCDLYKLREWKYRLIPFWQQEPKTATNWQTIINFEDFLQTHGAAEKEEKLKSECTIDKRSERYSLLTAVGLKNQISCLITEQSKPIDIADNSSKLAE